MRSQTQLILDLGKRDCKDKPLFPVDEYINSPAAQWRHKAPFPW